MFKPLAAALAVVLLAGCTGAGQTRETPPSSASRPSFTDDPYPSTYRTIASAPVLIQHATVLTGTGERLENADVLMRDGKVAAVGASLEAPADAIRVDGTGKWVTPGIIDVHSHLGVYPSPGVSAHSDGNEATSPVTPNVWAEHSVWPQDPGFLTALAGGITSMQVLPGSANLIGGRGVTLKNVPATTYQAMKFPGAPWGLKMACGENPKRVYGQKGGPSTRMANVAGYRAAFIDAAEYMKKRKGGDGNGADSSKDTGGIDARSTATFACTSTAIAPTRWQRCSTWRRNSASRSPRSIMGWRRTSSPTVSRPKACVARCGPTGGASRWRRSTASRKTSPWSIARLTAARSCIRIPRKASSASTRKQRR
jgi:hypothetical protein